MSSEIAESSTRPQSSAPLRTTKETHPNLPPGLILGPDGKVCKVCNSWRDWGKMATKKASGTGTSEGSAERSATTVKRKGAGGMAGMAGFANMMSGASPNASSSSSTFAPIAPRSIGTASSRTDCPPDTIELGRSTWTFLHTAAAYYPLQAPRSTQQNMKNLLESVGWLYPCAPCASDFREDTALNPPDVSGREGLSRWLCERHNEVNEKLGKERFDCSWNSLDRRWKDGPTDGNCD